MKKTILINNALLLALVALGAFFATQSSTFLTLGNIRNIALNSAILAVIVVGMTLLVVAGHVDLSVGSVVGMTGVLTSLAVLSWGWPPVLAILLGLAVGAGVGAINGALCGLLNLSPIIVTLGMLGAVRGATLLITVSPQYGLGGVFSTLGTGEIVGIPVMVIVAVCVFAAGIFFLRATPWGRYVYAVGVNRDAAYLSGLPVRLLPCGLYVVSGLAAGLAGVLFASRLGGAAPADLGINMELGALTAVLLGGVAFSGGRGSLLNVFFAVLFLGTLSNGLVLMNVQPFVQTLAQGVVLILAAGLDGLVVALAARETRKRRTALRTTAPASVGANTEGMVI